MTRYELLDRIGVGGMAEIFRGKAVAAGGFEKPVAIKRILPHLSQDKRFVELLIAEAKVLSLLKHRNIVQIFDVGLGDDGQYFLVMEYVDGKDLGAIQRGLEAHRQRVPLDLVLHVGAEICDALEHAHSARAPDGTPMSLVHRDVSPSNVLLSHAGEVKLTDFGIAKRAEQEATGHGAVRGKFAYISPEQARNEHIDPRSDVFSVGIVLWELLTTRRLFSGLGNLEALRAVRDAQVTRPAEVDRGIAPEVDAVIMTALSREPGRRPTARELSDKLRSLRYSLEVTVGDPATELAKIVDNAERVARQRSAASAHERHSDFSESTGSSVIRIHTADAFSMDDSDGTGISAARQVIGRFEDDEVTRLAQPSEDQLRMLRSLSPGGSADEEPTTAHPPIRGQEIAAMLGKIHVPPPHERFDPDDLTRPMAPLTRPAHGFDRKRSPGTAPPPLPGLPQTRSQPPRARGPTPGPPAVEQAVRERERPDREPGAPILPPLHLPPMTLTDPVPSTPPPGRSPPAQAASRGAMFGPLPSRKRIAWVKHPGGGLRPWMVVVGALVIGGLAFALTRALMSAGHRSPPALTSPK